MPDSPPPDQAAPNSLGLDLDALKLNLDSSSHVGLACDPITGGGQSW